MSKFVLNISYSKPIPTFPKPRENEAVGLRRGLAGWLPLKSLTRLPLEVTGRMARGRRAGPGAQHSRRAGPLFSHPHIIFSSSNLPLLAPGDAMGKLPVQRGPYRVTLWAQGIRLVQGILLCNVGTQLEFLPDCTQAGLPNRLTALLILLSGRENKSPRGDQGSGSHHFIPMVLGKGFGGRVGQGGQLPVCPFESPVPQTRLAPCVAALRGPGPFLPPPRHLLLPPTPTCTQSHTHTHTHVPVSLQPKQFPFGTPECPTRRHFLPLRISLVVIPFLSLC